MYLDIAIGRFYRFNSMVVLKQCHLHEIHKVHSHENAPRSKMCICVVLLFIWTMYKCICTSGCWDMIECVRRVCNNDAQAHTYIENGIFFSCKSYMRTRCNLSYMRDVRACFFFCSEFSISSLFQPANGNQIKKWSIMNATILKWKPNCPVNPKTFERFQSIFEWNVNKTLR